MIRRRLLCAVVVAACHKEGEVGGTCYPNGTCNAMLTCIGGVCIAPDAPPRPTVTATLASDVDILFVIDNSASTSDKQAQFAANFPNFVTALDGSPLGPLSLHLGVVTTSVTVGSSGFGASCANGDDGLLQNTPCSTRGACTTTCAAPADRYIIDVQNSSGGRTTNYTEASLAAAFTCIAQVGATGCGFESQLEGMKRALDGSQPENVGFLRPSAILGIVMLTDEDDCSIQDPSIFNLPAAQVGPGDFRCQPQFAYSCDQTISPSAGGSYTNCTPTIGSYLTDPAAYYQFLISLKDPSRVVVETIIGDPSANVMTGAITTPFSQSLGLLPSCTAMVNGNFAIARPGNRIAQFTSMFGANGLVRTICTGDYTPAFSDFASLVARTLTHYCIDGNLDLTDVDPANPGLQLGCTAKTLATPPQAIPACAMTTPTTPNPNGARPCYWLEVDATTCPAAQTNVEVHVEGLPQDTPVGITCNAVS